MGHVGVYGRIILKRILEKLRVWRCGLESCGYGIGIGGGSYEHRSKTLGATEGGEHFD
jgi:hypothetical protein